MNEPNPGGLSADLSEDEVTAIVARFDGDRTRLLDMVQAVQRRAGCIDAARAAMLAKALGMPVVAVEDMTSFYAFLDREPKGRFRIRLSRTPVSLMKGAELLARALVEATGAPLGGTSADGMFSLAWTSDIGMADQEPAALVNGRVYTSLTAADAVPLVQALRDSADLPLVDDAGPPLFADLAGAVLHLPQGRVGRSLVAAGPVLGGPQVLGEALQAALAREPEAVVEEISRAQLRGRGGAGFPTALKWKLCRRVAAPERHVVCNADEGEPGTFKDRVLLTEAPDLVFEGMTIAGYAVGARGGLLYLRAEYAYLWNDLQRCLAERRRSGLLGGRAGGMEGFDFDIRIQLGAGAYVCGEESALIESLEGKRGAPRDRPPFPTERGYLQQPTAVDNVETFACVSRILQHGAAAFARLGTAESTGTKLLSVSGDCERPGVYELPFGVTLHRLLDLVGAPETGFVQVGGPSGQCVAPKDFGRCIAYEDLSTGGSVMVFGPQRDVLTTALQFTEFFVEESCGWCTPCRVGTTLLQQGLEKILAGRGTLSDVASLEALAGLVGRTSRCGLGQTAPQPILSTLRSFPQAYEARLRPEPFLPRVPIEAALSEAANIRAEGRSRPAPGVKA
ncbi:NAD(P)H-dependent oxidoreductase subunit E [Aquabacterium sp. A7-Y]|uniref:NADH-ubiquinone oxidoreductase-F iron-sulfur binding region domain-containing protein n=1 Tax=Aquabacterium sp. A7-Y TaxID=1349605 RepID=UPI00223E6CD2|nr:NADH-ubiquinone oxidoreductase-F iron-sulfur binding region domain-containing protein [Aquabacterium sp. A7-Y]MCW7541113.1 NAD(P)H-dependent oxidoreductase subunit E [Aquabacterium sp. A7-Y]